MRAARVRTPLWARVAAAVVVLVPCTLWVADWHDRRVNEHRLAAIASGIAGRDVDVKCPGWIASIGPDTVAGDVQIDAEGRPADETTLRKQPCAELDALAEGRRADQLACVERSTSCGDDAQWLADAVDTITHESFHLKGIANEAATECYAMQTMAGTATQLGATEAQGRALATLHYETSYPLMPDQYRSTACAGGGALDLHSRDPRFP
jgi:hypothetical protein